MPGVSKHVDLPSNGNPYTGVVPKVVPGSAAVVRTAVASNDPATRFNALRRDDLPAFCAPTTHNDETSPTCTWLADFRIAAAFPGCA